MTNKRAGNGKGKSNDNDNRSGNRRFLRYAAE
jgi:hypothetical protein